MTKQSNIRNFNYAAYDGNGNQLPWSDGWYLDSSQHPEWRYNP